ncbi:bifunctional glycoside hydrolase 114/ polysaccharide deacetylase family protein [Ectopseudomonas composti]|uniref:bifunctional glycoside hydrolase 114/ polysaccharide deacetylase family protein n=1 Tax=Ectopseudomonas composti TaxID=658457 RepID=UPI00077449B8|nr:bifunctional glycoside hydrolase 114/ polysaccharide deacetylase family protein [Pseudomonas composti]
MQVKFSTGIARLFGLALAFFASTPFAQPASVAFWYADQLPLPELSQFEWVVVEPDHVSPGDLAYLQKQGSEVFAYLSIGEFAGDVAQAGLSEATSVVRNDAWNSQVMNLASPVWREHLFKRASTLRQQGYTGLFLDTLDSFQLQAQDLQGSQREALKSLLSELHRREPTLKLFFNRGFEVLPELPGVASAVAVESIYAGWDAGGGYKEVSQGDRDWLLPRLDAVRKQGVPVVAIEYLPPEQREQARKLATRLTQEGFIPYVTSPALDAIGVGGVEVQPRRIALVYDAREGELEDNPGHVHLGGLLEYLGYRVDYWPADTTLPQRPLKGLYAGIVVWMTSGSPVDRDYFENWLGQRLDEQVPLAFMAGMPTENDSLLDRLGIRTRSQPVGQDAVLLSHDAALVGGFEAPLRLRTRDVPPLTVTAPERTQAALSLQSGDRVYVPVATGDWGGYALAPYVFEEGLDHRRWVLDPFAFISRAFKLPALPRPDTTTENGRRIATVHLDGDGFVSRAEVPGSPYSGIQVLEDFIKPYPLLTSVSVIEGEVGPRGMYPHLSRELEPIAREIFANPKVEVASHTFSHPFFWQPEKATKRENFEAEYGYMMAIPGYKTLDMQREVVGARDYINQRLTTPKKPVKMIFWSGDAMPSAETIKLAYDSGLPNVNGGNTVLTKAYPSLTGLYPLIRPTTGGLHFYAPVINENVYTNLWTGPYYGFRDVQDTFALTDSPRRLRGFHLYYHFYSGTKQASIRAMRQIYQTILDGQPLSLWMSDYIKRVEGLYRASLARRSDGTWQVKGLVGMRTLRLDPSLGWPDLARSQGVAGVRDLPQGRYVHLTGADAVLALRETRDPRPALEEANIPLTGWRYLDDKRVTFSFQGEFPLSFSVRSAGACHVTAGGGRFSGTHDNGVWHFELPMKQVSDAQLVCN